MRSTLAGCCLFAFALASAASQAVRPPIPPPDKGSKEALEALDAQLRRGEWEPAEQAARSLLSKAMLRQNPGSFDALARLAVAEAGEGKTEDALWHWEIAQNLKVELDPRPFGAPGELLAGHPLRHLDEVPAGLSLRRPGDGGAPFSPPRAQKVDPVDLPAVWGARPKGIRLQFIIDAQGRAGQPVVVQSTSKAFTYAVLKAMRDWRFEPGRSGEAPVAAFFDVDFPPRRPLTKIADFTGSPLADPESKLRSGSFQEADKEVAKAWAKSLGETIPSRGFLGVALALKALTQAGLGDTDGAICRWQAAQTLEPRLYGADLSAYGAAGKILEEHPWGEELGPPKLAERGGDSDQVQRPVILKRRSPTYPRYAREDLLRGKVIVESIITKTGVLRNLVLLTPDALPGMEANTLDAVCDWRFKPATLKGEPVAVYYSLTTNFDIRR